MTRFPAVTPRPAAGIFGGMMERLAFILFLGLIVLSLWMYAGALPWTSALLINLSFLCGIALAISALISPERISLNRLCLLSLIGFSAYVLIQIAPLAPELLPTAQADNLLIHKRLISPDTWNTLSLNTISVSPPSSSLSLLTGISFFVILISATRFMQSRKRAKVVLLTLLISSTVMALVALLGAGEIQTRLLGLHKPKYGGHIFGSFTNRNHYACYMNLSFGLFLGYIMAIVQNPSLIADFSSSPNPEEKRKGILIMLTTGLLIVGSSSLATLSRGGALSALMTVLVFSLILTREKRIHSRKTGLISLVAISCVSLSWAGWRAFADRMATLQDVASDPYADARWLASKATLQIIRDAPFTGTGAGTFRHMFPVYQPLDAHLLTGRYLHAHNDWLEWLSEFGVLGILIMAPLLFGLFVAIKTIRQKGSTHDRIFVGGCLAALSGTALHAFFDYSLHRFANLTLLALVLGSIFANNRFYPGQGVNNWQRRLVATSFLVILLTAWGPALRNTQNEFAFLRIESHYDHVRSNETWNQPAASQAAISDLNSILLRGGGDAVQLHDASRALQDWAFHSEDPLVRLICSEGALKAALSATRLAPTDPFSWTRYASAQSNLGMLEGAAESRAVVNSLLTQPALELRRSP